MLSDDWWEQKKMMELEGHHSVAITVITIYISKHSQVISNQGENNEEEQGILFARWYLHGEVKINC